MIKYLFFLLPLSLMAMPDWFYNLKANDKNEIIGYGVDKTLAQAKENALTDVVKTISVDVKSSTQIVKSSSKNDFSNNVSSTLKTQAQGVLSGVETLKAESEDNLWYVAIKYDNTPFEIKLKRLLPSSLHPEVQNRYLKNTPLFKLINKEVAVPLDYKIVRKSHLWNLQYQDTIVALNQNDFYKLFSNQTSQNIGIKANKQVYVQNDKIYFDINVKQKGYVSILYIEHSGKVGVLLGNRLVGNSFKYPNSKNEEVFTVINPYKKSIRELYVALYSSNPIELSEFENVSEDLLDETNYNFNKLIEKFSTADFSTYTIKIRE